MPIKRPCAYPYCGTLLDVDGESRYCPRHETRVSDERADARSEAEPWRAFYQTADWRLARLRALSRDGRLCQHSLGPGKPVCGKAAVDVHHTTKVRELWVTAGMPRPGEDRWRTFVSLAAAPGRLLSVCRPHHRYLETRR